MFKEEFYVLKREDNAVLEKGLMYVWDELVSTNDFLDAKRFIDKEDAERFLMHNKKFYEYKPVKVRAVYTLE